MLWGIMHLYSVMNLFCSILIPYCSALLKICTLQHCTSNLLQKCFKIFIIKSNLSFQTSFLFFLFIFFLICFYCTFTIFQTILSRVLHHWVHAHDFSFGFPPIYTVKNTSHYISSSN